MASDQLLLSIVIAVYNVESYLGDCLHSIFHQDINDSLFEVICVNDCSTDDSVSIISGFQRIHNNILLLNHSKNEGLGVTRNTGFSAARGEYVWFVDADDYIRDGSFSRIIEQCQHYDLDIFHWTVLDQNGKILYPVTDIGVVSGTEDIINGNGPYWWTWDRVYKRAFLLDNNLWFSKKRNSDILHTLAALNHASRVMGSDIGNYYYQKTRPDSAMSTVSLSASRVYDYSLVMGRKLLRLSKDLNSDLAGVAYAHAVWQSNTVSRLAIKLPFREKKAFCKKIDKDIKKDIWGILTFINRLFLSCPQLLYLIHIPYCIVHRLRKGRVMHKITEE